MGGESCHSQAGDMAVALGGRSGGVESGTLSVSADLLSRFLEAVWLYFSRFQSQERQKRGPVSSVHVGVVCLINSDLIQDGFVPTSHKLGSLRKREPQLINYLHQRIGREITQ